LLFFEPILHLAVRAIVVGVEPLRTGLLGTDRGDDKMVTTALRPRRHLTDDPPGA
jgi:hypothetical protein